MTSLSAGGGGGGGGGSGKAQTTIIDIPIPKVDTTELEVVHVFPQGMGGGYGGGYGAGYPNGIPSFSVVTQENGTTQSSNVWGFNPGTMARKLNKDKSKQADVQSNSTPQIQNKDNSPPEKKEGEVDPTVPQLKKQIKVDAIQKEQKKLLQQEIGKEEKTEVPKAKEDPVQTTSLTPKESKVDSGKERELKVIKNLDQNIQKFENNDDPWILV
jgi:hypothetical protein